MSAVGPARRASLQLWFALLAPPAAWVLQFLAGFGTVLASCRPGGTVLDLPVGEVTLVATVLAGAVALLAEAAALALFRSTRDVPDDGPPPAGRVHFLSVVALTTTPLFFFIIVLSGIGAAVLPECRQS